MDSPCLWFRRKTPKVGRSDWYFFFWGGTPARVQDAECHGICRSTLPISRATGAHVKKAMSSDYGERHYVCSETDGALEATITYHVWW